MRAGYKEKGKQSREAQVDRSYLEPDLGFGLQGLGSYGSAFGSSDAAKFGVSNGGLPWDFGASTEGARNTFSVEGFSNLRKTRR